MKCTCSICEKQYDEYDIVDLVVAYEEGELTIQQTLELFSHLIKTDEHLESPLYFKIAKGFIKNGYLSEKGEILK